MVVINFFCHAQQPCVTYKLMFPFLTLKTFLSNKLNLIIQVDEIYVTNLHPLGSTSRHKPKYYHELNEHHLESGKSSLSRGKSEENSLNFQSISRSLRNFHKTLTNNEIFQMKNSIMVKADGLVFTRTKMMIVLTHIIIIIIIIILIITIRIGNQINLTIIINIWRCISRSIGRFYCIKQQKIL